MTIGNPNLYYWTLAPRAESLENVTRAWHSKDKFGTTSPATPGGDRIEILNDLTQMKTMTLKQTVFDAQVPTLTVDFRINNVIYFSHLHTNGNDNIFNFDLTTLVGNFGAPPLILSKGESMHISITDGNRLNNSDRLAFHISVWADVLGYGT